MESVWHFIKENRFLLLPNKFQLHDFSFENQLACWRSLAVLHYIKYQNFPLTVYFQPVGSNSCRSWWPRCLRHEPSSPARTLRSWVRIPLKAWMLVCVYFVCVALCTGRGLASDWSPVQGVLPTVYRIKKLKRGQGPRKGCRAMNR
jgi:hypothetical protein